MSYHILVAEDEEELAEVFKDILEMNGFLVTLCSDGAKAIETFVSRPDSYDLVLTDMSMPYRDGREVALAVREVSPETPVVLATGYGDELTGEDKENFGITSCLTKPVKLTELVREIELQLNQ